jgi:hypothetical protein
MCYNLTTVEHKEKSMGNDSKNFFNLGICKNLYQTLGHPLLWLLPISNYTNLGNQDDQSGYQFDANQETYNLFLQNKLYTHINNI